MTVIVIDGTDDRFTRCSYSELIRQLAEMALEIVEGNAGQPGA